MNDSVYRKVLSLSKLNSNSYVLRFEKLEMDFLPGQYISLGIKNDFNMREYSIYSSPKEPYLEVLFKVVKGGYLTPKLANLKAGDEVYAEGPFGYFIIPEEKFDSKMYFIATGTGISPMHAFVGHYPDLDYTLIHGIRYLEDQIELERYKTYISCVTRQKGGFYNGRITDYLNSKTLEEDAEFYLCGNCDMIYDVIDILAEKNIDSSQIHTEVYF